MDCLQVWNDFMFGNGGVTLLGRNAYDGQHGQMCIRVSFEHMEGQKRRKKSYALRLIN